MNNSQVTGVSRIFLVLIAYWAKNHLPPDFVAMLPAGWENDVFVFATGLLMAGWSMWENRAAGVAKQAISVLQDHPDAILKTRVAVALAPSAAEAK